MDPGCERETSDSSPRTMFIVGRMNDMPSYTGAIITPETLKRRTKTKLRLAVLLGCHGGDELLNTQID